MSMGVSGNIKQEPWVRDWLANSHLANLEVALRGAEELGLRLESVGGLTVWEASPVFRHQEIIDRIRATIHPVLSDGTGCGCVHAADVYVRFADGSLKRPDIAIFCRRPDPDEARTALTLVPEAVIEITSEGYEAKDFDIGVPFYLKIGVKDVVVYNPETNEVHHFRPGQSEIKIPSPCHLNFVCGCECIV